MMVKLSVKITQKYSNNLTSIPGETTEFGSGFMGNSSIAGIVYAPVKDLQGTLPFLKLY